LTIAGIKPNASKKIQIQDTGIPVIEWYQENHHSNNSSGINPCGWMACEVEYKTHYQDAHHCDSIANIHGALVKPRLRFKTNLTMWTGFVHFIKLKQVTADRILKDVSFSTSGAFTLQ